MVSLNKKSNYKDWRIPTLEEILALVNHLPHPTLDVPPYKFWTSTETEKSQMWAVSLKAIRHSHTKSEPTVYLPKVSTLQKTDNGLLIPVRTCENVLPE